MSRKTKSKWFYWKLFLFKFNVQYQETGQHVQKYAKDLFDSRVLPMQKHVTRCTHGKALVFLSSAIVKHLLENDSCAQMYTNDCFTVIGRAETTFKLCFKGGTPNTQAKYQHSEGNVWNTTFHPIRARIQGEAAALLLKPSEDAGEFDRSCWSTSFFHHDLHVLKLYKTIHRFNSVAAKNLEKLQFQI